MPISWPHLVPALFLLLVPIALFHGSGVRYRAILSEWQSKRRRIFGLPHHSIDLLRAAAGAWLLAHAVVLDPAATGAAKLAPAILLSSVILTAVLLQTVVCREADSFNAPFAFLVGLTVGFLPPLVAGVALVVALTVALGSRVAALFFVTLSFAVLAAGTLFTGTKLILMLAPISAAALIPWLLALLFGRELTLTHRVRSDDETRSPLRHAEPV